MENLKVFNRFHARWAGQGLQLLTVNIDDRADDDNFKTLVRERRLSFPILRGTDDVVGIYNILYRYMFDRHRDLGLPIFFLIDDKGRIVKVYQGPVNPEQAEQDFRRIPEDRLRAVGAGAAFSGIAETYEFGRTHLSYGAVFFSAAISIKPRHRSSLPFATIHQALKPCYGLGSAYLSLQKTAEARESFEHATKLRASYPRHSRERLE